MNDRGRLGAGGEDAATAHLAASGYQIVERNFRCKEGELDIVARDGSTIVFCEVKTRRSDRWGDPSEAVNPHKQARIRRLAAAWFAARGFRARDVRFDVISVVTGGDDERLDHIIGAF